MIHLNEGDFTASIESFEKNIGSVGSLCPLYIDNVTFSISMR